MIYQVMIAWPMVHKDIVEIDEMHYITDKMKAN